MSNNEYLDFDDYFNDETKVSKENKSGRSRFQKQTRAG